MMDQDAPGSVYTILRKQKCQDGPTVYCDYR